MSGWYEVSKSSNGQFRFVLKAANAETILTSELYTTRAAADGGIASVQTNSPLDERYEKKTTKDGHPYFNLKAANHQIIGSSESYSSDAACDKGIASVKANGSTKTIKDKTLPVL
ncbi:YegP family protein [Pseudomonas sp. N40(2020)]|uniref:YegP family protein n=1 Tax=Pseudomonas sp. N40(2020) TaxID=2767798 RepID=UPI001656A697|nr:YegP family protein [Pseudomonas sp. N40(2020)]MBC8998927.1 YegP family protein [Pseudomonas sp. N40(2020)]